jgi:large subunit ribosomal protein L20
MPRAISGAVKHKRTKKILKQAKGYRGARSKLYRTAREAVMKSGLYAYRDRKAKKRNFRKLWIARISAGTRKFGLSYNAFIHGLKESGVMINRKYLSYLSTNDEVAFKKLVEMSGAVTNDEAWSSTGEKETVEVKSVAEKKETAEAKKSTGKKAANEVKDSAAKKETAGVKKGTEKKVAAGVKDSTVKKETAAAKKSTGKKVTTGVKDSVVKKETAGATKKAAQKDS